MAILSKAAVGWITMGLGASIALTPTWAAATAVGSAFTLGFGAITVMYGAWSLIARDATRDHWALPVVGLILFLSPWVTMYAGDSASWVAWTGGLALIVLCGGAYVADEAQNVTEDERVKAIAAYQIEHGQTRAGDD